MYAHGRQFEPASKDLPAVQCHHQIVVQFLKRAHTDLDGRVRGGDIQNTMGRGLGQRADLLVRKPDLPPCVSTMGRKEGVIVLVEIPSGLRFNILTVTVCQEILPDAALA